MKTRRQAVSHPLADSKETAWDALIPYLQDLRRLQHAVLRQEGAKQKRSCKLSLF